MSVNNMPQNNGVDAIFSGFAPVNGLNMYYEIYGTGMPLILIHGGGSTIQTTFGKILHLLAASHKVIAVEMQAHGRTADIDRPLSFEHDADDIAGLLNFLKIEKANIFGFSNGANTALQCAIRHPKIINKIVVASTFYNKTGTPTWFWDMMNKATFEEMPQQLKDAFLMVNPNKNALYKMFEKDVLRMQSFQEISSLQMKTITAPAFIIVGDNDIVLPEHAVEMHRLLTNSTLAIIPGGHGDYIGEITTKTNDVLIAYTVHAINNFLNKSAFTNNN